MVSYAPILKIPQIIKNIHLHTVDFPQSYMHRLKISLGLQSIPNFTGKPNNFIYILRGKFGINLPSSLLDLDLDFRFSSNLDFKISKNERGKFSKNFTYKHVIPG